MQGAGGLSAPYPFITYRIATQYKIALRPPVIFVSTLAAAASTLSMTRSLGWLFWPLAVLLGLATGYVYLMVPDPTLVALLALASAMFLGVCRPQRPWQWAIILAASIPAADLWVRLHGGPVYRGRIEGAFVAGLVSGVVGAYAGAVMRKMVVKVFDNKA